MLRHPAHCIALGFGSGLAPRAPGTVGTLWAWVASWCSTAGSARCPGPRCWSAGLLVGCWACTRAARHMGVADPGAIVWDEIIAFWAVLWLIVPAGLVGAAAAFALFRYFDAAKPGPGGLGRPPVQACAGAAARLGAGLRHPVRRSGGGRVHAAASWPC